MTSPREIGCASARKASLGFPAPAAAKPDIAGTLMALTSHTYKASISRSVVFRIRPSIISRTRPSIISRIRLSIISLIRLSIISRSRLSIISHTLALSPTSSARALSSLCCLFSQRVRVSHIHTSQQNPAESVHPPIESRRSAACQPDPVRITDINMDSSAAKSISADPSSSDDRPDAAPSPDAAVFAILASLLDKTIPALFGLGINEKMAIAAVCGAAALCMCCGKLNLSRIRGSAATRDHLELQQSGRLSSSTGACYGRRLLVYSTHLRPQSRPLDLRNLSRE